MDLVSDYSVVIIGAGPAGCSCAISILNAGVANVTLVDTSKTGKFHIGESIPPEMNPILRQLGISEAFLAQKHEPCFGSCSYWGNEKRGYNDSILSPFGHGWHLNRSQFNQFLVNEAVVRGAKVLSGHIYQSSTTTERGYQLNLKSKAGASSSIEADFVVDASGARSIFATDKGSKKQHETPLVCLALRFKNKGLREVSKLTHLESVENGWWYAARIPNEQLLVTLYTNAETVKKLRLNNLKNWIKLLQQSPNTHQWIAQMEPIDQKLLGFPAQSFCLDKVVGENWLAIGDAASAYDPITSQGIIKAITQGMRAAEIIGHCKIGAIEALPYFQKEVMLQYDQYKEARQHFYCLEQRWLQSQFWREMHGLSRT
ncbi:flavin-dependent dehydrogenase [Owenweeksia hongkongensis DSM 17368]|uniref:Flavin-dependent dehydrogenase n=1 Tax=Owenweeksia hongkongensis (strain DSM 17368 / CIP 108786 / JCM 12287 / NRRL B-23963 / UST20020801) TaxID=926562 RepID=G8R427_OWEHD|nr:NAD(P)/FAD-dependent oxidoreductase [Owenweeksia hongkongensis]AEV33094.1 flavin-dependent dehydrogenase [Owenweeksia hongkongensis DSM 17368]